MPPATRGAAISGSATLDLFRTLSANTQQPLAYLMGCEQQPAQADASTFGAPPRTQSETALIRGQQQTRSTKAQVKEDMPSPLAVLEGQSALR